MNNRFTVVVCDDNKENRDEIKKYVSNFFSSKKAEYEIKEYTSGDELIGSLKEEKNQINLVFLDIEMPGINGLEVKNILCDDEKVERIVFVSNHINVMQDAFGMKVMGFIVKPITVDSINKWLTHVYNVYSQAVRVDFGNNRVRATEISYIQADGNYTKIALNDGTVSDLMHVSIINWIDELGDSFVRCHKSFLVNMDYILKIKYKELVLTNGVVLPVGRKYYNELKDDHSKYLVNNIKGRLGWGE